MVRLAEESPDREACGFVARGEDGALHVLPVPNVAGRAGFAFRMDLQAQLAALRALAECNGRIDAVYHSHVDAEARLSAPDRAEAVAGGAPLFPGADQVVLGLRRGRVEEIRRYRWDGAEFVEIPLQAG
jgi:proteasome lid subunit RPN8/RPN11